MFYEIIVDKQEKANKCTIVPLADRADFRIYPVKGSLTLGPFEAPILLHHQGECLTEIRKTLKNAPGIASIDCVWSRLDPLVAKISAPLPRLAKIPEGFQTAYPRKSKRDSDPSVGLATIEALFIAAALLGHWDESLLSKYYFGGQFLEKNQKRFLELGIDPK